MYNVSDDFKGAILNNARRIKAHIEINGKSYDIQKCTLDNNIYSTDIDAFIGTFIAKSGTIKINKQDSLQLENGSFNLFFGIQLEDGTVEHVPMGQMNVYEKTSETEFKFMDNKIVFNKKFDTTSLVYPSTLLKVVKEACRQAGIELDTLNFLNKDISIPGEVFFGYDATCADVITAAAQASCTFATINREDKLEFRWFTMVNFSIPLDNQYKYPTTELSYGPINSLVLAREPQNDNVYIQDEESIKLNGLTELKFSDNPFLDIDRYTSRNAIWSRINGFSFIPFIASVPGQFHLDAGDIVSLQIEGNTYINAYILNHTMAYSGGIKSDFTAPALTKSQINYKIANTFENKLHKTELTVDKIKGEIKAEISDMNTKIDSVGGIIIQETAPQNPIDGMKWLDTSVYPNILKIYDDGEWVSAGDFTGSLDGIKGEIKELNTSLGLEQGRIEGLIKDSTVTIDGEEKTVKETVEKITIDLNGITNTVKTTSGNNLIRDSLGCFNDGSWDGNFNLDSTPETRKRNPYGYAVLLKKGTLKQQVPVANGTYTLSFIYKKLINLAKSSVVVNGEEFALSNSDFTEFKYSLEVTSNFVTLEFVADTDNSCPIINLMLNKGDQPMEWSLNPNETWSDTVQIGRGIRISSSGTDVVFVANADIIGFMNKQGEYITTFDDEGLVANSIVVKNKATIVNLLIQDINDQTVINRINPEEVEVFENGE